MASPQKEKGYTVIANELLEALAKIRIPGEARQILDVIIRKTYGFNKKEDLISYSQFTTLTNIKRTNIRRAIVKLRNMNIIHTKGGVIRKDCSLATTQVIATLNKNKGGVIQKDCTFIVSYRINKDYESWLPISKTKGVIEKDCSKPKKCNPKGLLQKKDSIKKVCVTPISENKKTTQQILNYFIKSFKEVFKQDYHAIRKDWQAAVELQTTHSLEKILDLIDLFFEESETNEWLRARCTFSMFNFKVNDLAIKLSQIASK